MLAINSVTAGLSWLKKVRTSFKVLHMSGIFSVPAHLRNGFLASMLSFLFFSVKFEHMIFRMRRFLATSPAWKQETALLLNEITFRAGSIQNLLILSPLMLWLNRIRSRSIS